MKKIEEQKLFASISKKYQKKKRECLVEGCKKKSIRSHVVQRKGILDQISVDNHVYVLGIRDFFNEDLEFKRVGLKKGMSFPLFCNIHDTSLFRSIEDKGKDFNEYKSQCLLSYRAVCSELRKKEIQLDIHTEFLEQDVYNSTLSDEAFFTYMTYLHGLQLGIADLRYFKVEFEKAIKEGVNNFQFYLNPGPRLEVATSAIFSPTNRSQSDIGQIIAMDTVFINVLPVSEGTIVIVGYHKEHFLPWIKEYCMGWSQLSSSDFTLKVSNLLMKRCETWAMSPILYDRLSKKKRMQIIREFEVDLFNMDQEMFTSLNIFE